MALHYVAHHQPNPSIQNKDRLAVASITANLCCNSIVYVVVYFMFLVVEIAGQDQALGLTGEGAFPV